MKAVTIPQPRASFVAVGATTILTMDWATAYRGPLAIHAATRKPSRADLRPAGDYRVRGIGSYAGGAYILEGPGLPEYRSTPQLQGHILRFGAIVATCELVDVVPIVAELTWDGTKVLHAENGYLRLCGPFEHCGPGWTDRNATDQRPFGDFTPGRFAWLLDGVKAVDPLFPLWRRGRGGLWDAALDSHP